MTKNREFTPNKRFTGNGIQWLRSLLTACAVLFSVGFMSQSALANSCYVVGDISQSKTSHPLGSRQNPYGSLADVETNLACLTINVLYSESPLDGGIALADGQQLIGRKGPGGELPVITNTTSALQGRGVVLARNNELRNLHIKDTENSAIFGNVNTGFFGGSQTMQGIRVTGANQQGLIHPILRMGTPSILLVAAADSDIVIRNSDIGESRVPSIGIFQIAGHGDVRISNTTVRDQTQLSNNFEVSPGVWIFAGGNATQDIAILDTSVINVGSSVASNTDGLLLTSATSGEVTIEVDGYYFSNPDAGGWYGTSTGIELGLFGGANGASFTGTISNSVIESPFFAGIQVLDDESQGNNRVSLDLVNNQISDTVKGIQAFIEESNDSKMLLNIVGNSISTSPHLGLRPVGMDIVMAGTSVDEFTALIEKNTVEGSSGAGFLFQNYQATIDNLELDAGLGGLGSTGENRIIGSFDYEVWADAVPVSAKNNWWGSADGPASIELNNGATVDVDPILTEDPAL